jgi:hypothetical protein
MPRTTRGRITLAEEQPRSRRHRWVVRVVIAALVTVVGVAAYAGGRGLLDSVGTDRCQATAAGTSVTFDPEQMSNAATITAIAMKRGLPARAATIALATAITESKLRNLRYGDRDSLGLFQQRPSQGWGTAEQILDPDHATNAFYDALVKIKGYESTDITTVAQQVQHSAYPEAYANHEQEGRVVASAISGYSPGGLGCRLSAVTRAAAAAPIEQALTAELGFSAVQRGSTLVVTAASDREAWSVAAWAVAKASGTDLHGVTVGTRQWTRARGSSGWSWTSASDPQDPTTVVLHLG